MRVPARLGLGLLMALLALPAMSWEPETRVHIADDAVRLMPASLRVALQTHRADLLRGMLEPMIGEDGVDHRPPWAGGHLVSHVEDEARGLALALSRPTPFGELAFRLGTLGHFVSDAGFPPAMGEEQATARAVHFATFCHSRRARLPLVFEGHAAPELTRGDWRSFATGLMSRASGEDRELSRAYAAAGQPPDPAAFDDRSVPFALCSLAYSHSVNDVVRAWLALWEQAAGDLAHTPYRVPARQAPRP